MKLTENQQRAVEAAEQNVCVDAGAGSGKTRVLVDHVFHLIERRGVDLDEIVAITFTDKAAAEMKQRLRRAFRARGNEAIGDPDEMSRWRMLERRVETARICTIHSFCAGLLRQNALTLGLDPDLAILTDAEDHLLQNEVVEETLHGLLDQEDEHAVRLATEHGAGTLIATLAALLHRRGVMARVTADAISQDPTQLMEEWCETVRRANANRVAAVASELKRRLTALDGCCSDASNRREILRQNTLSIADALLNTDDVRETARLIASLDDLDARGGSKKVWDSVESFDVVNKARKEALDVFPKSAACVCEPEVETRSAELTSDLAHVYATVVQALDEAKLARNACDFDDLIALALDMLRQRPDILERVSQDIRHLLIDEFQDTNHDQFDIARLLTQAEPAMCCFFVGDAKQSIYEFRGAEVDVFEKARQEAQSIIRLDRNFRAVPDVLAFVNDFFERSRLLENVEREYAPLVAEREEFREPRIAFLLPPEEPGTNAEGYREEEARLVAERLVEMCATAPARVVDPDTGEERDARFGDAAILFRSLRDVYTYEKQLRAMNIPYTLEAGAGFYERQEVTDVRNLLTLLVNPWDDVAMLGFLRSPMVGLSDDAILNLCGPRGLAASFFSDLRLEDATQDARLTDARALLVDLQAHTPLPLPRFLRYLLTCTEYEAILLGQFLGARKAGNVRKIMDLAEGFARTRTPTLSAFVRYLDDVAAEAIREGEAPAEPEHARSVQLMTIHKAKGLEFPIVVLPDLSRMPASSKQLPVQLDRENGLVVQCQDATGERAATPIAAFMAEAQEQRDQAEHARVLYVAMTRARDWLLLGGSPKAHKKSWLASLDEAFSVLDRSDDDTFGGDGWQARVYRAAGAHEPSDRSQSDTAGSVDIEKLRRRMQPLPAETAIRTSFAVTELLEHAFPRDGEPARTDAPAPAETGMGAAARGTLVHALLERWDFRSEVRSLAEELHAKLCPASPQDVVDDLVATAERLRQSSLGQRLTVAPALEREARFLLRVDDALISGAIDLMMEDGTIIDYKTGRWKPETHTQYEWQVQLYAAAVRQLLGKKVPDAFVCYVDTDDASDIACPVDVSDAVVDEALERARAAIGHLRQRRSLTP